MMELTWGSKQRAGQQMKRRSVKLNKLPQNSFLLDSTVLLMHFLSVLCLNSTKNPVVKSLFCFQTQ